MPLIIAHRGASGYLPEHTLAAKRLAHNMGADYLEQDVVATRDDELVVLHDIYLDRVTNVAERFAGRQRDDGRFYVRDFDLAEIRELKVWERMNAAGEAVFPSRYPARTGQFRVHTLREEIALVHELNANSGRVAGIYPEIKRPAWHRAEGVDIGKIMKQVLLEGGYSGRDDPIFVQCFDSAEVRRLRLELEYPWRIVQLIAENTWGESASDYDHLRTPEGLAEIAEVADAIGPWLQQLYSVDPASGLPVPGDLTGRAQQRGLAVHPYTFRRDDLPPGFTDYAELVRFAARELGVDGIFTDFPDITAQALAA